MRYIFIIAMVSMLCIRPLGVYFFVPPYIDSILFSTLALFGMVVISIGILNGRIEFNFKRNLFLFLFLFFFILSCVVNVNYGVLANLRALIWISISFFVLYCQDNESTKQDKINLIITVQNILIIVWLIFSFYSLLTFIFQINYCHEINDNVSFRFGYIDQRLFGVFSNPNYGSMVSLLTIIFSIMQITSDFPHNISKKINILNVIIQVCYIALASTRGTLFALLVLVFLTLFIFMYNTQSYFKDSRKIYVICILLFVSAVACIGLYRIVDYIKILFSYIPSLIGSIFSQDHVIQPQIIINRMDFVDNQDVSNLRFSIWHSAFEIFKTRWFFGTSPGNLVKYAKSVLPNTFILRRPHDNEYRTHNAYVGMLLYTGLSGAVCIFAFFIQSFFKVAGRYVKNNLKISNPLFNAAVTTVLCVAIYGMFEAEILFVNSISSFVFWLSLGFVVTCVRSKNA